jgi:hypothetical protein
MKIAINQSYFFPYLGYFQLIASADVFVAYEHVAYTRRSWISRNRLQGKSPAPYYISLPIAKRPPEGLLLSNVMLADTATYKMNKLMKRIKADYKSAPFFTETYDWLEEMLAEAPCQDGLHQFNVHCINAICARLKITTRLSLSHNDLKWVEEELAQNSEEDKKWRTTERIRLISGHFGADTYVNLPGGQILYDQDDFRQKKLTLEFLSMPEYTYQQFEQPFVPYLSILDTLMHCGMKKTSAIVNDFKLQPAPPSEAMT